jgi:hypothetical protein
MSAYPKGVERRLSVWDYHARAAVVEACLGRIPEHAWAVGVAVDGWDVFVRFALWELGPADWEDIGVIGRRLRERLGPGARVHLLPELQTEEMGFPGWGVCRVSGKPEPDRLAWAEDGDYDLPDWAREW